jgi:hypothetical protein
MVSQRHLVVAVTAVIGCTDAAVDLGSTSQDSIMVERGTDRASAFSVAEAKTLKSNYSVSWTGVYIGGSCSAGSGWTKATVTAIANATGWTFMPIWVGSQSSAICNTSTLTYARGQTDGVSTAATMAEFGWGPNLQIPVALDVEAGTYEDDPADSTSYIHGWLDAVHAAGYLGYIYSSPSGIVHYGNAGLTIDGVWVAAYQYSAFEDITPADLTDIGTLFSNHDRAWQYAGSVSIPGVGGVDCNTSDLLLAPAPGGANATCQALPAMGGIIDDGDACFDAGGPSAYLRSVTDAGYGGDLIWTHATDEPTEANYATWNLDFAEAGTYHVEVYTAAAYAQSKQAKYVVTAAGSDSTVQIDQTANDGWQALGDFEFAAGSAQQVHLGDNTGEAGSANVQLVFDAVRISPTSDAGSGGSDLGSGSDRDGSDDGSDSTKHGCDVGGGAGLLTALPMLLARRRRGMRTSGCN